MSEGFGETDHVVPPVTDKGLIEQSDTVLEHGDRLVSLPQLQQAATGDISDVGGSHPVPIRWFVAPIEGRSLVVGATPGLTWDPREGPHRANSGQARGCPMRGPAYGPSPQVKPGVAPTV
jgi:hypothetical protein